jgi:hypothetical protein
MHCDHQVSADLDRARDAGQLADGIGIRQLHGAGRDVQALQVYMEAMPAGGDQQLILEGNGNII